MSFGTCDVTGTQWQISVGRGIRSVVSVNILLHPISDVNREPETHCGNFCKLRVYFHQCGALFSRYSRYLHSDIPRSMIGMKSPRDAQETGTLAFGTRAHSLQLKYTNRII